MDNTAFLYWYDADNYLFSLPHLTSGSLIIDIIAAGGKVDAPVSQRVFLVYYRGVSRYRATAWRRTEFVTGGLARNRLPVCDCPIGNGGLRLDWASTRFSRICGRIPRRRSPLVIYFF